MTARRGPVTRGARSCGAPGADAARCHRSDPERGSATVLLLAIIAVALTLAMGAVALGRAAQARGVAQTAADLAAIAAAQAAQERVGAPCAIAETVARANSSVLAACTALPGGVVDLTTSVTATPLPGWSTIATAQARAGPVR